MLYVRNFKRVWQNRNCMRRFLVHVFEKFWYITNPKKENIDDTQEKKKDNIKLQRKSEFCLQNIPVVCRFCCRFSEYIPKCFEFPHTGYFTRNFVVSYTYMFLLDPMKRDADKTLEVFQGDLETIRVGRAKPSLVENILVDAYGTKMKLLELAGISAPEPTQIIVKPWDRSVLSAVEKAIQISDLHINPVVDGDQIRISIPPLTGERREELAKLVV